MTLRSLIGMKELSYALVATGYLAGRHELEELDLLRDLANHVGEDASLEKAANYLRNEYDAEIKKFWPNLGKINRQFDLINSYNKGE